MKAPDFRFALLSFVFLGFFVMPLWAQPEKISLSQTLGSEIDAEERERYHLFPSVEGFESAVVLRRPDGSYRLKYTYRDEHGSLITKTQRITAKAVELTRLHVALLDEYFQIRGHEHPDREAEARSLYELALAYAAQMKYREASVLADAVLNAYSDTAAASRAKALRLNLARLEGAEQGLFSRDSMLDQSGRTDLLIFSGYYGIWLGLATPLALRSESAQVYAAGLLLVPPLSLLLVHHATKDVSVPQGRATMIILGGHLGTWQGLGWSVEAGLEGSDAFGVGELSGLAGIGLATLLSKKYDFSASHAGIMSSAMNWGAWYGLVFATILKSGEQLRAMLIGSDLFVLGAGLSAKNIEMSKKRLRLINLSGALGIAAGFGIDMLFEVHDGPTAFAIAGLSSVAGLLIGRAMTKNYDARLSFLDGASWTVSPELAVLRPLSRQGAIVPAIGFRIHY